MIPYIWAVLDPFLNLVIPPHRGPGRSRGGAQMWGNHLFGRFKKVIPLHRVLGGSGEEPRCGGITSSTIEKIKKVIFPHRVPCGGITFSAVLSPAKLKKVIPPRRGPGKEPRCVGITFSAVAALKSSKR